MQRGHRDRRLETKWLRGYLNPGAIVLLTCLLAACSTRGSTSSVPTTAPAAKGWNVVASPGVGQEGALGAVTAISASDAWAVGQYEGLDGVQHPLAEHWDGAQWSQVASPSPGSVYNILGAVSGDASGDVWAVGQQSSSTRTTQPLIERWDGGSWKVLPATSIDPASGSLGGVAAISPSDVWAVGSISRTYFNNQPSMDQLIEHWDGNHWSVVAGASLSTPTSPSGFASLSAVAAISASDVWAVGSAVLASGLVSLIEHWDGHAWKLVDAPSPTGEPSLTSISAAGANDVWAVGSGLPTGIGGCGIGEGVLVEHWDGARWTRVSAAEPTSRSSLAGLTSVAAAASNDVWVVGGINVPSGRTLTYTPLIEHWDGAHWNTVAAPNARLAQGFAGIAARPGLALAVGQNVDRNGPSTTHIERWSGGQWSVVASPSPGTLANALSAVTASSSQDVWAVGNSSSGTLTEHWNGSNWHVVPSPNGTPADNMLYGVSAASPNDVWAVGTGTIPGTGAASLIEHWDGTQWSLVMGAQSTGLRAVAAISARDVWAGGDILEHYDGSAWHAVSRNLAGNQFAAPILGMAAIATNDIWAVGGELPQGCGNVLPALIQHWDGKAWSVVPNTPVGTLYGVAALGPKDVWAVGDGVDQDAHGRLVMHYDGKSWVALPGRSLPQVMYARFRAVAGHASNDVWAVGSASGVAGNYPQSALVIEHWDGSAWSAAQSPANPGSVSNELDGVVALSASDVWAVGSYGATNASQALLMRYGG